MCLSGAPKTLKVSRCVGPNLTSATPSSLRGQAHMDSTQLDDPKQIAHNYVTHTRRLNN